MTAKIETVEVKDPVSTSETVIEAADSEETGTKAEEVAKGCAARVSAHRWKPGQSGNAKGRPAGPTFASHAKEWLSKPCNPETAQTRMERLVAVLGTKCLNGDMKAMKEFLARVWPPVIRMRDETPPTQLTLVCEIEQPPPGWCPKKALEQGQAPVLPGVEQPVDTPHSDTEET